MCFEKGDAVSQRVGDDVLKWNSLNQIQKLTRHFPVTDTSWPKSPASDGSLFNYSMLLIVLI